MQVIGCQLDSVWEDKPANFARVRSLLAGVNIEPGALVVLPEMFATGFSMNVPKVAEGPDGETHAFLADLATELKSFVLGGVITREADGRLRNQAVVFGPDRREVARYSKQQPFTLGGEADHYSAGVSSVLFNWQGFAVAPFVCYDLRFPEIFRPAVQRGANLIVVIACWPMARDAHWLALLRARAIENQAYVVGVNRVGREPKLVYRGYSLVVGPGGETLAAAGEGEQLVIADLQLEPLVEYRRKLPFLSDIRPENVPQL